MKPGRGHGDIEDMTAAGNDRVLVRGSGLLIAHCAALSDVDDRTPVVDRLRGMIGADLTRLLLVALAGDHRMRSRDLAA
jgi:hypothetical protein